MDAAVWIEDSVDGAIADLHGRRGLRLASNWMSDYEEDGPQRKDDVEFHHVDELIDFRAARGTNKMCRRRGQRLLRFGIATVVSC